MILITGSTGMFGGRVLECLLRSKAPVRGLTRSQDKAATIRSRGAEAVVGDLDEPETLPAALRGVDRVFLVSAMDEHIARRETNLIRAAAASGVRQVVKLFGAVRHRGDRLTSLHEASIEALRSSGLGWALVSPNTVMESNLLPLAGTIKSASTFFGAAGEGAIGMVAADDCADAAATVLTGDVAAHHGQNYEITGPEALTFGAIAARFSRVLGRRVTYQDMAVEELGRMLVEEAGFPAATIEMDVLCHARAFRRGDADLVTDTYRRLTGREPTSVDAFLQAHWAEFA
jgi:uncharacterized protein YbjT (DUF2867 family)